MCFCQTKVNIGFLFFESTYRLFQNHILSFALGNGFTQRCIFGNNFCLSFLKLLNLQYSLWSTYIRTTYSSAVVVFSPLHTGDYIFSLSPANIIFVSCSRSPTCHSFALGVHNQLFIHHDSQSLSRITAFQDTVPCPLSVISVNNVLSFTSGKFCKEKCLLWDWHICSEMKKEKLWARELFFIPVWKLWSKSDRNNQTETHSNIEQSRH